MLVGVDATPRARVRRRLASRAYCPRRNLLRGTEAHPRCTVGTVLLRLANAARTTRSGFERSLSDSGSPASEGERTLRVQHGPANVRSVPTSCRTDTRAEAAACALIGKTPSDLSSRS